MQTVYHLPEKNLTKLLIICFFLSDVSYNIRKAVEIGSKSEEEQTN